MNIFCIIKYGSRAKNMIKEAKIKTAIILVWNFKDPWVKGLLSTLKGLLNLAEESGLEKPLTDFSPFTIPHIGVVSRAVYLAKEEYGLPTGCGPGNATTKWTKSKREWGSDVHKACESSLYYHRNSLGSQFSILCPYRIR
jgi:tetrahydromethanopterin S-methyltransferase subunit H